MSTSTKTNKNFTIQTYNNNNKKYIIKPINNLEIETSNLHNSNNNNNNNNFISNYNNKNNNNKNKNFKYEKNSLFIKSEYNKPIKENIQTITDDKILNQAQFYISIDESLDEYLSHKNKKK